MKTEARFCDVCGMELKQSPACVFFELANFTGEIKASLNKISGAYAEYCVDCMKEILANAVIKYGEVGTTRWMPKDGSVWRGFGIGK